MCWCSIWTSSDGAYEPVMEKAFGIGNSQTTLLLSAPFPVKHEEPLGGRVCSEQLPL